jgi:hypothetical protein
MSWTSPADLKAQVQKLWDRGLLLAALAGGEPVFPRRLTLKGPDSRELSERFPEVREWIARLTSSAGEYRIEWRKVQHRVLGANDIPAAVRVESLQDALKLIGRRREAEEFSNLVELTREKQPELVPWLGRRPLRALELSEVWPRLLEIAGWVIRHPRPGIYLRQIDLPGVHTKLIEEHRGVLTELLDLVLPEDAVDMAHTGVGGFCRRYGFLDKPGRVRFRILDEGIRLLPIQTGGDITLTQSAFASMEIPVSTVFITENEVNFLAFPDFPDSIVIFGAGYGFDNLAGAGWLRRKGIFYWGDIDTHGFAILNQLRSFFPNAVSFLMDERTLLAHRPLWGTEAQRETGTLTRLNPDEKALCDRLRTNHWGDRIRFEQERVGYDFLKDALKVLQAL